MLGKLYLVGWIVLTIINTLMALNADKSVRILMLIGVIVLQQVILLLFMVDYDSFKSTAAGSYLKKKVLKA